MSALEEYRNVAILVVDRPGFYTIVSAADGAIAELDAELAAVKAQLREGRSHTRHEYPDFSHRCVGLINDVIPPDRVSD